jgi:phage shock protein PspC (stress-responsive transcriptional regulator)
MVSRIRRRPWGGYFILAFVLLCSEPLYTCAANALEFATMPSLIRLLMVVGLLGGAAYGAMFALANFVQPKQREMSITIPQQRLSKPN